MLKTNESFGVSVVFVVLTVSPTVAPFVIRTVVPRVKLYPEYFTWFYRSICLYNTEGSVAPVCVCQYITEIKGARNTNAGNNGIPILVGTLCCLLNRLNHGIYRVSFHLSNR